MFRYICIGWIVLLGGCRQQGLPQTNPFLAPSRVPPPATRAPAPGTAVPYYQEGGSPGIPPIGAAGVGSYGPMYGQPGDITPIQEIGQLPPASPEQIRRATLTDEPRQLAAAPPRQVALLQPAAPPPARGDIVLASGTRTSRSDREMQATVPLRDVADSTPRTSARYGYDARYRWLQGRLEYSEARNEWKLRYIPVDGTTDDYGGSVVIDFQGTMGDLAPGDYVRIEGQVLKSAKSATSYSPLYRASTIRLLAD